jgi:hypothetical protein
MTSSTDDCAKAVWPRIFEVVNVPHPSPPAQGRGRHLLPQAGEVKVLHLSRLRERTLSKAKQVRAVHA